MNNMGVLKTWNGSTIFNNRLSWFIYTPTKKFKNHQENPYFLTLYTNFIQYRTQYRQTPTKINTFAHFTTQITSTIKTTFFLYKYKNPKRIHTFTDYQLFTKNHIKTHNNHIYI